MAEPIRAVIAEDNYLVREGLRRLLEDSGEVDVVACVGSATRDTETPVWASRRSKNSANFVDNATCTPISTNSFGTSQRVGS